MYECENCDDTGTCPCGGSGCDGCDRNDPGRCRCHQRPARGDICPQEGCHESCLCNVLYGDLYVSAAEHHAWLRGDQPAELDARDLARLGPSTRGLADAPTWGERPW